MNFEEAWKIYGTDESLRGLAQVWFQLGHQQGFDEIQSLKSALLEVESDYIHTMGLNNASD